MKKEVEITCTNVGRKIKTERGTNAWDIALQLENELGFRPIVARINNSTEDLDFDIYHPCQIEFVGIGDSFGIRAYTRSLTFLIASAVEELLPGSWFHVRYAVSNGYYCKLYLSELNSLKDSMTAEAFAALARDRIKEWIPRIKKRVAELSAEAIPFERVEEETAVAITKFEAVGRKDIAAILGRFGKMYTTYYRMGKHIDFYYGPLVHDTSEIQLFDIEPYMQGLLLRIPDVKQPSQLAPFVAQEKMHSVFQEYTHWNWIMGVPTVSEMNEAIAEGHASELIKVAEALQEKRIAQIADAIAERKGVRIVLIAGPSSSGKTTFSKRLSVQLAVNRLHPIAVSLDDYFVEREETPLDEKGQYDYESLYALDLKLFNTHLRQLLNGEKVNIPTYNFATGSKEYNPDKVLQLSDNDILILEGIHALNPALLPEIPHDVQFKIYASALTSLLLDSHNRIRTTDNRLLRRIIRDCQYRSISCQTTIARWPSVRAGENKWIFPYQEQADAIFNSALLFELSVLKPYVEPELMKVPESCPEYSEAQRLLRFLSYLLPIADNEIPSTSLLREFVGGSSFRY